MHANCATAENAILIVWVIPVDGIRNMLLCSELGQNIPDNAVFVYCMKFKNCSFGNTFVINNTDFVFV